MSVADRSCLFLLPHQDDEVFVIPRILEELRGNASIFCAFLTKGPLSVERNQESVKVLLALGICRTHIHFVGDEEGLEDGKLVQQLDAAFTALTRLCATHETTKIYAPAWEGGHQDHDATALLAWALGRAVPKAVVFFFPTYQGENRPGRLFSVMKPLLAQEHAARVRRIPLRDGWRAFISALSYRTQRQTWVALAPGLFFRLVCLRRDVLLFLPPNAALPATPPHAGALLYERYGRMRFSEFFEAAAGFIDRQNQST